MSSADMINNLIERFEKGDYAYEEMALVPIENQETLDALANGLRSKEWRVILACTKNLSRSSVNIERVVDILVKMLRHDQDLIQEEALKSLGRIGPPAASSVMAILKFLQTNYYEPVLVKESIIALGKIGSRRKIVAPIMIKLLRFALETNSTEKAVERVFNPMGIAGDLIKRIFRIANVQSDGFEDSYGITSAVCEYSGKFGEMSDRIEPLLLKALEVDHDKVPIKAAKALLELDVNRDENVKSIVRLIKKLAKEPEWVKDYEIRELVGYLYEYGHDFSYIIVNLAKVSNLPTTAHDDPAPLLKNFVADESFTKEQFEHLVDYLGHKDPTVRIQALRLMPYKPACSCKFMERIYDLLKDEEIDVVRNAIISIGKIKPDDDKSAELLNQKFNECLDDLITRDLIRGSLARMGKDGDLPMDGINAFKNLIACISMEYFFGDVKFIIYNHRIFFALHKILKATQADEWKTDEESFAVGIIDQKDPKEIRVVELPLLFRTGKTGGHGAKREFSIEAIVNENIIFVLKNPFSDQRGWGNDNFMYAFNTGNDKWFRLSRSKDGEGLDAIELPLANPSEESAGNSVGFGELIVWKDSEGNLKVVEDNTPYHLDNWEISPEAEKALDEREASWLRNREDRMLVSCISDLLWVCDSKAYPSFESLKGKAPEYRIYNIPRLVIQRETRFTEEDVYIIRPVDVIEISDGENKHLALMIRLFMKSSVKSNRNFYDYLVIIKV